jgi:hypothetical protein
MDAGKAPKGPVSIIISGADRAADVYRNGVEIGRTPVSGVQTARRRRTAGLARR